MWVNEHARPPASCPGPTRPALPVLRRFEDGLADALDERLGKADDNIGPQALALRASVLAHASVAAMRSTLIALIRPAT